MRSSPLLRGTAAPPIPEAKGWAARYDGAAGPLIDLSQAVPGYPPHPGLLQRLGRAAATAEAAAYGDILGDAALRTAYAEHVSAIYGAEIGAADVAITAGCNQALFVAMIALAQAGDAVMLPSPWYFNHKMALDMLGIEALPLPCRAEEGFVPSVEEARRFIGKHVRAIVLVTPNNPTGAIYPPATIAAFHALCLEHGIALILDETYRDFIGSARPHDCLAAAEGARATVQLYSFSKAYCIPGHRIGAIVADADLIREIAKVLDTLQICAPRPAQLVLPWAIPALAEWREANRTEILARAAALREAVAALHGWSVGSLGAYFAYLAHPFADMDDRAVCEMIARKCGVLALPGSYFGGAGGFLRVAFANVGTGDIAELPARLALAGYGASRRRA